MNPMIRIICLFSTCLILFQAELISQTTVQAFTYSSTTRDTVITFPEGDHNEYEKILMLYSMRCTDGLISPPIQGQTNNGCGEWDYSCNTYIEDPTQLDSLRAEAPNYVISNFSDDEFPYTSQQTYRYVQATQKEVNYTNVINENEVGFAQSDTIVDQPFASDQKINRSQILFKSSELISLGMSTDPLTGLKLDEMGLNTTFSKLKIKVKNTNADNVQTMDNSGFVEVYYLDTDLGANPAFLKFHEPFVWDGSSNLLLDISYTKDESNVTPISGEITNYKSMISSSQNVNRYAETNANSVLNIGKPISQISEEITIAFWVNGNEDILPANTALVEANDANNNRQVMIHFPWSNGQIYWDCGNEGGGYDRINKPADKSNYAGEWNHWAFTKNAVSGTMQIYLNGALWHSGEGLYNNIDIQDLNVFGSITASNLKYYGKLDEFTIWNKALNIADINGLLEKNVTIDHPLYENLMVHYDFEDGNALIVTDRSSNGYDAAIEGVVQYENWLSTELEQEIISSFARPNLIFVQGEYESVVNEYVTVDSFPLAPNEVKQYELDGTDLVLTNTSYLFHAKPEILYDEDGNIIDMFEVVSEDSITIETLVHYSKSPMKLEIMSFVTPYGINLDLGPQGKTWTFDVTDFGPALKGDRRIYLTRGGQWQEEMDIKFVFYEGTPVRDVHSIQQLWPVTSESFGVISENEFKFEPRSIVRDNVSSQYILKNTITGHGQQGEFVPRTHFIRINDLFMDSWTVWTECSENPIFPQGGTWIFDRAGWCPGAASDTKEVDITDFVELGDSTLLDYGITTATGDSRYIVSSQLIKYGEPNFEVDAYLEDILYPTNKVEHARFNPTCGLPKIRVKNNGTSQITSLKIEYGIEGNEVYSFDWSGDIGFLKSRDIELNFIYEIANASDSDRFFAEIVEVNGAQDGYEANNSRTSEFDLVDAYLDDLIINMRTNSAGNETGYKIFDMWGNAVLLKQGASLTGQTTYFDTLQFKPGCYKMVIEDSDDDGLEFFANGDGNGFIRVKEDGGFYNIIADDFGRFREYHFTMGEVSSTKDLGFTSSLRIFPNPATDEVVIANRELNTTYTIYSISGQIIQSGVMNDTEIRIDISQWESGMYIFNNYGESFESVKFIKE